MGFLPAGYAGSGVPIAILVWRPMGWPGRRRAGGEVAAPVAVGERRPWKVQRQPAKIRPWLVKIRRPAEDAAGGSNQHSLPSEKSF